MLTAKCDYGRVALVLGDVIGHQPAAVFTAEVRYTLRGFVREHEHPAHVLTQMNAYLCESHRLYQEGLNESSGLAAGDSVGGRIRRNDVPAWSGNGADDLRWGTGICGRGTQG